MGAKQIVFVAKHVGGFCWWQTDTTDYGVKNTAWRGGKGDVMRDLAASCRRRGLKLGVYLRRARCRAAAEPDTLPGLANERSHVGLRASGGGAAEESMRRICRKKPIVNLPSEERRQCMN
jgi:alpha-L-fucosidase